MKYKLIDEFYDNFVGISRSAVDKAVESLSIYEKEAISDIWNLRNRETNFNVKTDDIIKKIKNKVAKKDLREKLMINDEKELEHLLSTLSDKERDSLLTEYSIGQVLEEKVPFDKKTRQTNYKTVYKLISKLGFVSKRRKKIRQYKSFFEVFKDFTKEEVEYELSKLTEEERMLLYKKYGADLKNVELVEELTNRELLDINAKILNKIKKRIMRKRNGSKKVITLDTLLEEKGITKEEFELNKDLLNKYEKDRLVKYFNDDFKGLSNVSVKYIDSIITDIMVKKLNGTNIKRSAYYKSLTEVFKGAKRENESDEDLLLRIKDILENGELSEFDTALFYKKYGKDLNNTHNNGEITDEENYYILHSIIYKMRVRLKAKKENQKLNFFEKLSFAHKDLVLKIFNSLTEEEKQVIKKAYGDNFEKIMNKRSLTKKEYEKANNTMRKLKLLILKELSKTSGIELKKLELLARIKNSKKCRQLAELYGLNNAIAIVLLETIPQITDKELMFMTGLIKDDVTLLMENNKEYKRELTINNYN